MATISGLFFMSRLPSLINIYRQAGYEPLSGYNSHHFEGWGEAPFTKFVRDGSVQGCGGLAIQEVMFLEGFAPLIQPRNILVIGNALGWSTVCLALTFPQAKVAAIDPNQDGNALTNRLGHENGLNLMAADGFSPQDVTRICHDHLDGPLDMVLIDAIHTNEAVLADFAACHPLAHDRTLWVFHDVLHCNLVQSFKTILADWGMTGSILTRTPSGMAACWKQADAPLVDYVQAFTEDPALFKRYRRAMIERLADRMTPILDQL